MWMYFIDDELDFGFEFGNCFGFSQKPKEINRTALNSMISGQLMLDFLEIIISANHLCNKSIIECTAWQIASSN